MSVLHIFRISLIALCFYSCAGKLSVIKRKYRKGIHVDLIASKSDRSVKTVSAFPPRSRTDNVSDAVNVHTIAVTPFIKQETLTAENSGTQPPLLSSANNRNPVILKRMANDQYSLSANSIQQKIPTMEGCSNAADMLYLIIVFVVCLALIAVFLFEASGLPTLVSALIFVGVVSFFVLMGLLMFNLNR